MAAAALGAPVGDVKRAAQAHMTKLLDRDTEAMAAAQLDAMARSLSAHSLPSFLSAISDARPHDKTPLRRHCVRLLSLLSLSHPPRLLSPLLPRMLHSLVRRLRDPDSSVRAACVDASRAIASASVGVSPASTVLRPLSDALLLEQDIHSQMGSALCLAAAIDALAEGPPDPDRSVLLQRLLPRLVKLARSDAFKAKPALLGLMGAVTAGGGAGTPAAMGTLVSCLSEFLASEDWAARKAAAEALCRVAKGCEGKALAALKAGCVASCESCKFDKVKTVRESMNRAMEAWKEVPDSAAEDCRDHGSGRGGASVKEVNCNGQVEKVFKNPNIARSQSDLSSTRKGYVNSRSPPREASPAPLVQRSASNERRPSPPLFRKIDRSRESDWRTTVSIPQPDPSKMAREDNQTRNEGDGRSFIGTKKTLFGNSFKEGMKLDSPVVDANGVAAQDKGRSLNGFLIEESYKNDLDSGDLSQIRKQLIQIENQQSGLIDLLQKFIGSSQNGMLALEKRVYGLEMALDEISQEMSLPTGRMGNADLESSRCCRLPGTEFLSSKFWRRADGRYSSRSPGSGCGIRKPAEKTSMDTFHWDKQQYGIQNGYLLNPLAAASTCSRGSSTIESETMLKKAGYATSCALSQNGKAFDGASTSTCSSMTATLNRST